MPARIEQIQRLLGLVDGLWRDAGRTEAQRIPIPVVGVKKEPNREEDREHQGHVDQIGETSLEESRRSIGRVNMTCGTNRGDILRTQGHVDGVGMEKNLDELWIAPGRVDGAGRGMRLVEDL